MNIYTLSRAKAENIERHYPDKLGAPLISIGNPRQSTGDLDEDKFGPILRLHFHDADPNVSHGQVKGMKLLDNGQVKSIINFVEKHDPNTLFVQCQAGQSRSCGVAYALNQHYNDEGLKDGWENYNRFVKQKVSEALRGYKKDQNYYEEVFGDE